MPKDYYVYIMTNQYNTVLYVGVTNDILRRVQEHKAGINKGFTSRYRIKKLVYYEVIDDIESAILREKQLKAGNRARKIQLIESLNPDWHDLFYNLI